MTTGALAIELLKRLTEFCFTLMSNPKTMFLFSVIGGLNCSDGVRTSHEEGGQFQKRALFFGQ